MTGSTSGRSCTPTTMNMAAVHSSLHSDKVKGKQDRQTQFAAGILLSKLKGSKSTLSWGERRKGVLGEILI